MSTPYRILCVCMGNVCRSPTAEVVIRKLLEDKGLGERVIVASAGTHGYRAGESSDSRAREAAWRRGYNLSPIQARKIGWQDLADFDLILAMDKSNLDNLRRLASETQQGKLKLLMDYAPPGSAAEIPDPYTTLGEHFEHVLDMIETAAHGLVDQLARNIAPAPVRARHPLPAGL